MLTEIERLYHSALLAPQPTSVPAALQSVAGRTAHRSIQEGEALSRRGMSTGATALLDLAVERYMGGLSEQTPAFQASLIVGAIADTLRKRFEFSRDPNDLKDAVTLLELISSNIDPAKFLDRDLVNVTAVGLVASYYAGGGEPDHLEGELDHLDMAVELGQALLIHGAGDPAPWRYLNTTAGAYSARYVRDGRIADLDRAFRILERAIAIVPKTIPTASLFCSTRVRQDSSLTGYRAPTTAFVYLARWRMKRYRCRISTNTFGRDFRYYTPRASWRDWPTNVQSKPKQLGWRSKLQGPHCPARRRAGWKSSESGLPSETPWFLCSMPPIRSVTSERRSTSIELLLASSSRVTKYRALSMRACIGTETSC